MTINNNLIQKPHLRYLYAFVLHAYSLEESAYN